MRPRPAHKRELPWASIVAVCGTALVALAASLVWLGSRKEEAPPAAAATSVEAKAPSAPSAELVQTLDADLAIDKARAEAQRWNPEAVLAGMEIGPFVGGKLVPEGTLRAEFGKPAGANVGPGAGLQREILMVTVSPLGVTRATKNLNGAVGIAEPNCIVQDVWAKVLPDVVDATARLFLRYELNPRDGRAVYRIKKEGSAAALRVLDGGNCSFLVR
jgi:hypothetical protein